LIIGQSSGTTGEPKFFPLTAQNAIRRADAKYLLDPAAIPVVASMFNVLHAAIYFVLLRVFAKGGTVVFSSELNHWKKVGVTMLMASPMHAAHIFAGSSGSAGGKIPRVWLAGSPIYPAFLDQALEHFDEVINAYGAMEASIVCHHAITHRMAAGEVVGVGRAMDDVVLEVVDESGKPVETGEVGEVRYKTPLLVSGYIGDDEATRTFFRNGWFYPGDTGFFDARKQLFITGRVNDLLNIGGTKLNAAAVDGVLQSTPGVTDGACFTEAGATGFEKLSVVVVVPSVGARKKIAGELLKRLAKQFARQVVPHSVYFADTIPRNDNGKVLRIAAREKAQSGDWHQVTVAEY
jgi:acyl-CoA synthetase (AMP-forming)/AMP-acid ligase II